MSKPVPHPSPAPDAARTVRLVRLGAVLLLAVVVVIAAIVLSGGGSNGATTTSIAAPATAPVTPNARRHPAGRRDPRQRPTRPCASSSSPTCSARSAASSRSRPAAIVDGLRPQRRGADGVPHADVPRPGLRDRRAPGRRPPAAQDRLWHVVERPLRQPGRGEHGLGDRRLLGNVLAAVPGLDAAKVNADARHGARSRAGSRPPTRSPRAQRSTSTPSFLVGTTAAS